MKFRTLAAGLAVLLLAGACSGYDDSQGDPYKDANTSQGRNGGRLRELQNASLFGDSGLNIFGSDKAGKNGGGSGIGVNVFLWRAALDTISFAPLSSADPFGGVMITDWYAPPETPDERFKMNVYILGRELRADAVRVAVFRQKRDGAAGQWADSKVTETTATNLENEILTRARQMRVAARGAATQ